MAATISGSIATTISSSITTTIQAQQIFCHSGLHHIHWNIRHGHRHIRYIRHTHCGHHVLLRIHYMSRSSHHVHHIHIQPQPQQISCHDDHHHTLHIHRTLHILHILHHSQHCSHHVLLHSHYMNDALPLPLSSQLHALHHQDLQVEQQLLKPTPGTVGRSSCLECWSCTAPC